MRFPINVCINIAIPLLVLCALIFMISSPRPITITMSDNPIQILISISFLVFFITSTISLAMGGVYGYIGQWVILTITMASGLVGFMYGNINVMICFIPFMALELAFGARRYLRVLAPK